MDTGNLKKNALLAIGILSILGALLFGFFAIIYFVNSITHTIKDATPEYSISSGIMLSICTLPFLLIAIVTLFYYFKLSKTEKKKELILGTLKLYRRITLPTLAKELGMNAVEVEKLLIAAIAEGKIKAFIDRNTMEIFVEDSIKEARVENVHCPNCGSVISGMYMLGEVVKCNYCGTVFKVEK